MRLMLRTILSAFILLLAAASAAFAQAPAFDAHFTEKTMRVDYYHTGGGGRRLFALDAGRLRRARGPGSRTQLIDDTNLGPYFFEVDRPRDEPGDLLARLRVDLRRVGDDRRAEAGAHRTFHESLRFPWPKHPVQVVLKKRDRAERLPRGLVHGRRSRLARSSTPRTGEPAGKVWTVFENGPAATKVDLLILGDGYAEADLPKFHADVKRLVDQLFATEPFKSRQGGLQRPRDRPAVAAKRREPAAHRRTSAARRLASPTTSSTPSATC